MTIFQVAKCARADASYIRREELVENKKETTAIK
jgi:hypothetical protein